MNPFSRLFIILGFILAAYSVPSQAEIPTRSKLGMDLLGYKTNFYTNFGWMAGLRYGQFLGDSQVYLGLAGYYGTPQGNALSDEYVTMGGVLVGYEFNFTRRFIGELSFMTGYGEGKIKPLGVQNQSFFVVEPGFSAGYRLGGGWKIMLAVQYLHMNHAKDLSGFTCGFRVEFKSATTTKPVND